MNFYKKLILEISVLVFVIFGISSITTNYLFFHVVAELFSIIIMCLLFAVTMNGQKFIDNRYLLFVGSSGIFIGALDLLHTLTFDGMNIIVSPHFYANQFWVATRFFESIVLLTGFLLVAYRKTIRVNLILSIFSLITIGIILSILYFHIFPVCYIRGEGQTDFKIASEFIIIGILGISLILLVNSRSHFSRETYRLILFSIALTILSELCFTFYFSNYDFLNKLGHVFKVLSFYMIYKANIYKGFNKPIETFFNELKQNEEKIKEYSKELEKQVATRNKFFSIISHDLKNPFTVLMGYSELLLLKHKEISEEVREKYIANLYDSSKLTFNLLENLLTWSSTQTKTIPFEPVAFDITEAIKKNISLLGKNAELKDISLENKSQSYQVWADIEMIKTVIRNLLTNAIKFTPRGGLIKIETHVADGLIITSIADSGVGMSEEKVNSLFHLDKTSSAKGTENESGTGLGLILCCEFVQKNQGKIWVESEPGRGTKISFSLKKA